MIYLQKVVFEPDLNLNVEIQAVGLCRVCTSDHHAPRQVRVRPAHDLLTPALSPVRGSLSRRVQSPGFPALPQADNKRAVACDSRFLATNLQVLDFIQGDGAVMAANLLKSCNSSGGDFFAKAFEQLGAT